MKRHLIAYLDSLPEADLAKILNWSLVQANALPDRTVWEEVVRNEVYKSMYVLEKPE